MDVAVFADLYVIDEAQLVNVHRDFRVKNGVKHIDRLFPKRLHLFVVHPLFA